MDHMLPYFILSNGMIYYVLVVPMLWMASYIATLFFPVNSMSNVFAIVAVFLFELCLIIGLIHFEATHRIFN